MNIAIIPARGGSKRIPRKNIRLFDGKPMIAHAITAAKKSEIFEHIVVSTDDEEIMSIAKEWGAEIPFIRPTDLADDYTTTIPVVAHSIESCQNLGWKMENVCCIYPAVPFIQTTDLKSSLEQLKKSDASFCFPIAEYPSAVQRALKRGENGQMQPFYPEYEFTRTQDLEKSYFDAGQFYWGSVEAWLSKTNIHSGGCGFVIPAWRAIDIDLPEDWQRAELLFKALYERKEEIDIQ